MSGAPGMLLPPRTSDARTSRAWAILPFRCRERSTPTFTEHVIGRQLERYGPKRGRVEISLSSSIFLTVVSKLSSTRASPIPKLRPRRNPRTRFRCTFVLLGKLEFVQCRRRGYCSNEDLHSHPLLSASAEDLGRAAGSFPRRVLAPCTQSRFR